MKNLASLALIAVLGLGLAGCSDTDLATGGNAPAASDVAKDAPEAAPVEEKKDDVPSEYKSALKSAENYNKIIPMSKAGLLAQLTSEAGDKFSPEAGQYAVDNIKADWNENALKSAKTYQETMAMSPEAIREQLTSEYGDKYTAEEADYAVANLG